MAEARKDVEAPAQPDPLDTLASPVEVSITELTDARIRAFVDNGHKFHQEHPRKWQKVPLPDSVRRDTLRLAKNYAREQGLTFHVQPSTMPDTLIYRVAQRPPTQAER